MIEDMIFPYESALSTQNYWSDIQNVYTHIVDAESRDIYINRLLLSFTKDIKYVKKLILCTDAGKRMEEFLNKQKLIYIYGAGIRGNRLVQMFPEMRWQSYIDKNRSGMCNGINIIKPQDIRLEKDAVILIANYEGFEEIKSNLISFGIEEEKIVCASDYEIRAHENQYFDERCIKYFKRTEGNFIDAGCFDGRNCIKFFNSNLNNNTSIFAFEPDRVNYQKCKEVLSGYNGIKIYNMGLSDKNGEETFLSDKGEKARVSSEGNEFIEVNTLDSLMPRERIGFLKMDIEGSEKRALMGARQCIERDTPNMMISIYHKMEDIIEIPKLLLDINPEYRFAFGHYSSGSASDTIIYVFE